MALPLAMAIAASNGKTHLRSEASSRGQTLVATVALAAAVMPALDAAQVDPAETLRLEN